MASTLPTPTRDLDRARHDLDEYGYALVADALSATQIEAMFDRLVEQAECEGLATGQSCSIDDPATPMVNVGSVLNKGTIWQDLLDPTSPVHQLADHIFSSSFPTEMAAQMGLEQKYLISSIGAQYKRTDPADPRSLHIDQAFAPAIGCALVANVFYLLTDFYKENGATYVVPGSHKRQTIAFGTHVDLVPEAIPVVAPAGTAFVFEGRTWHATGYNTNGALRSLVNEFWCAPYIRQREMLPMNLRQDVIDRLSDAQLKMLGFDTMYQGPAGAFVGFGLIEPTLGRDNVSHKMASFPELHRRHAVAAE